jgi:hypothetical protein
MDPRPRPASPSSRAAVDQNAVPSLTWRPLLCFVEAEAEGEVSWRLRHHTNCRPNREEPTAINDFNAWPAPTIHSGETQDPFVLVEMTSSIGLQSSDQAEDLQTKPGIGSAQGTALTSLQRKFVEPNRIRYIPPPNLQRVFRTRLPTVKMRHRAITPSTRSSASTA